jgi:hypothetical protein
MRIKTVISILAFALTFGFSAYFASFFLPETSVTETYFQPEQFISNASDSELLAFLKEDVENGHEVTTDIASMLADDVPYNVAQAEATESLADKMEFADIDNFPADFQTAWQNHTTAWRNLSDYLNEVKDNETVSSKTKMNKFDKEITRTYMIVLKVGKKYDSNVKYLN